MRSRPGEDAMPSDYYKLLEIPKAATASDVKKAYRRLALKYHPDKNPDNQEMAEKRFKKIAEAYEVLSDADKKRTYDQFGKQGLFKGDNSRNSAYSSSFHNTSSNFRNSHHHRFQDPQDIFAQFFGDSDPFASFFHTDFDKKARSTRPRSAFGLGGGLFDNFPSAFEEFDIFFNMPNNRRFYNNFGKRSHSLKFSPLSFNFQTTHNCRPSDRSRMPSQPENLKSTTTSTKYVDGKKVITKRVIENGVETITVEEDGFVTSHIITYL